MDEERLLVFSIGIVLLISGLAIAVHFDMLLAMMTLGVIVTNLTPRKSRNIFKLVKGFTPPIYVLFFVLVGAKLNIAHLNFSIVCLGFIYLVARSAGKAVGANFGSRISSAPKTVQRYLPLCLFSQAGVAIGLSILARQYFPGQIGDAIVVIVTVTAFILEIIGPLFVKIAVTKAGEVGLSITEENLIEKSIAKDFRDKTPPLIYRNTPLSDILNIFSESDHLYYPVVDEKHRLIGTITIDNIKSVFSESSLNGFILADDLIEPVVEKVTPETSIIDVRRLLNYRGLEYLPVVDDDENKIMGSIEKRLLNRAITTKLMELQEQANSLDEAA